VYRGHKKRIAFDLSGLAGRLAAAIVPRLSGQGVEFFFKTGARLLVKLVEKRNLAPQVARNALM
jgi:hypothetical protein